MGRNISCQGSQMYCFKYNKLWSFHVGAKMLLNNKANWRKHMEIVKKKKKQKKTKRILRERITDLNVQCCGNATLDSACMSHRLNSSLHFFEHVTYLFICSPAGSAPSFLCFLPASTNTSQYKGVLAFGVLLIIHDALESPCPFQTLF